MGETGKRFRRDEIENKNQKRRIERDQKSGDELIVYRILCPDTVIGSVIGKSGKVINSIRQDTKAKVKVVDPFPGSKDRVITVYCYVKEKGDVEVDGEFDDRQPFCAAQDALLKVHAAIANAVASGVEADNKKRRDKEECQILVPASQSANIIGKSGTTIKKLRSRTRTNIRVMAKDTSDPAHSCALAFDNFVMISGDPDAVKKALFAISAIMYKFGPKEEIPLDTTIPEPPPSIIIPSDVPIYTGPGIYSSVDPMGPPRHVPPVLGPGHVQEFPSFAETGNTFPVYSSALPVVSGYGGAARSEDLCIRILCPSSKIGRVIGKGGSSIKSVRQDTGARVEVEDAKADRDECIITVFSTESSDDRKSIAVEAVLMLQAKINDEEDDSVTIRLLVPSKVIGCIIGKSGSIISEIRKRTKAEIRISKGDKPRYADGNDELVEVVGEASSVRDALISLVLRLRDDVLRDKEGGRNNSGVSDSMYSSVPGLSVPPVLPNVRSVAPLAYEQRAETGAGVGILPTSSIYGYGPLSMGDSSYGPLSAFSSKVFGELSQPSRVEIVVPAHAVVKVMGKGGTNLENIRKISGADVEILESKSSRGDRVALIAGTPEQKRAAENLIQAFIMAT
ncbi:OLC1v1012280C3 [Oldenlandia corymbosa var. corymbosa]|uniref:OLC1v1012280C3 n=1 Tax=Oldenlandia corymbosa var. corymbosa TaxID=529605 RepID=A0AAV1DXS1_OLDCO|nr:OLC1v1012280C3 [Oldenlandia corymbosa var. corymbosa]